MINRSSDQIVLKIKDKERTFQILGVLPFTSERKRMSIMVRDLEDNRILHLIKGADEAVFARLKNKEGWILELFHSYLII